MERREGKRTGRKREVFAALGAVAAAAVVVVVTFAAPVVT